MRELALGLILLSALNISVTGNVRTDSVHITEFMAVNSSVLQDEEGDFPDWIEIHNPGAEPVNLEGWSLTDRADNPLKWLFPDVTIGSGDFLIVFASGKDRRDPSSDLHTNFKLSGSGEYLALFMGDGQTLSSEYGDPYPAQYQDVSFGIYADEQVYFTSPTPGSVNAGSITFPPPRVSVPHGFYQEPFSITISGGDGTDLFYTTDGSEPSSTNGSLYHAPVEINTTTVFRAVRSDSLNTGRITTVSYIFPQDVLLQNNSPEGYPAIWGEYSDFYGIAAADYEMDPEVVNHADYGDQLVSSLLSLPSLSLVMDKKHLFSHEEDSVEGGIYIFTGAHDGVGSGWERPVSVEYFGEDSAEGFQIDCGVQLQGGASRQAEKSPKHSFRLEFKGKYGPARLRYPVFSQEAAEDFNTLILRAAYGNSWRHFSTNQRKRAQHIRDPFAKDTQLDMRYYAAHNKFAHLYLNGMYWGLYNISERLDREHMQSYYGGSDEDFDILKDYAEVMDGNRDAWDHLWDIVNEGNIDQNEVYQALIGNKPDGSPDPAGISYVDPVNLCDYVLLNFYGGNNDWDHHNWVAARNRISPGKGFQFFSWDTEKILEDINENQVGRNNSYRPTGIFRKLRRNAEFRLLFADRAYLHLTNEGLLTPDAVAERWMERADEIEMAMIAESARWGDYRRDVHSWSSPPFELYTQEYWYEELDRLQYEYFPDRTEIVLNQLRNANLLPDIEPPVFSRNGGLVPDGYRLEIVADAGDIWYTTDGSDPRKIGGDINPAGSLYGEEIALTGSVQVKARAYSQGDWSALTSALFDASGEPDLYTISLNERIDLGIYPNPVKVSTMLSYYLPKSGNPELRLYSLDGMLVHEEVLLYQLKGDQLFEWQPEDLAEGMYLISISLENFSVRGKLLYLP